jgi:AcrR family transcriptional regulator
MPAVTKAARKTARKAAGKAGRKSGAASARPKRSTGTGRRAANKAATRDRIVRAALELFEKKGFEATTTKEIAKRARIAEGTVFNYFETKEDIALHFFELEVDHAIATVRGDRRLRKAPLEEKLFALVQSQIEYLSPYERFIGAAFMQALKPASGLVMSTRSWALRARYLAFVEELIEESLPRRQVDALSWLAPQAFWLFYLTLLLYWLYDPTEGKQSTLAFLDRSLRIGAGILRKGSGV